MFLCPTRAWIECFVAAHLVFQVALSSSQVPLKLALLMNFVILDLRPNLLDFCGEKGYWGVLEFILGVCLHRFEVYCKIHQNPIFGENPI